MSDPISTVLTPATSFDLVALDTVKSEFGITDRAEDAKLARWITHASGRVAEYCNRSFSRETIKDTFRLSIARDVLLLSRYPVASITSVTESTAVLSASDYEVNGATGALYRLSNDCRASWCAAKIVVEYVSGYSLPEGVPSGIQRACISLVSQYRFCSDRDPQLRSETMDGVGSSSYFDGLDAGGLSPEVRGLLEEHRKPSWA